MSDFEPGSNIGLSALIVGVRIKTDCALLIASQDGHELDALDRRAVEIDGMIELLKLAKEPSLSSIRWLRKQRRWLVEQRKKLLLGS